MTKAKKRQLIREVTKSLKEGLLAEVDRIPDNWDGREIRHLVADYAKVNIARGLLTGERKKDYENECIIKNLW